MDEGAGFLSRRVVRSRDGLIWTVITCVLALWLRGPARVQQASSVLHVPAGLHTGYYLRAYPIASGFVSTTDIANAGDDRLFVAQLRGEISILPQGRHSPAQIPFLDIRERVSTSAGEQGLASIAFHPNYETNGYFFVAFTDFSGNARVSRFQVSQHPDIADPDSETPILIIEQPSPYHNVGELVFGNEGLLYVAVGDGGPVGNSGSASQDLGNLYGSILRLDVDGGEPYAVPPDNPFVDLPEARGEIWAYGLRNPWRIATDRQTGDFYITDVGEHNYEEINRQAGSEPGGRNYGWPCFEGRLALVHTDCDELQLTTLPVFTYNHAQGCAIIGGPVYRGMRYPELNGHFVFADLCRASITTLIRDQQGSWSSRHTTSVPGAGWHGFGEDRFGEVYVGGASGVIYQLALLELAYSRSLYVPIAIGH